MAILVFDSGVGGLSVLQEVVKLNPQFEYLYLFDNGGYPYGECSPDVLIKRCCCYIQKIDHLMTTEHHQSIDAIIIACNTASTIVLPYLRALFTVPVIGVVPAIKSATDQGFTQIGLLATPATIKREYTLALIEKFAKGAQVHLIGETELVRMAEAKVRGNPVDLQQLKKVMQTWRQLKPKIEAIVLGCTHFPLLHVELQQVMGSDVVLIDSGYAVAKRVHSLLGSYVSISHNHNHKKSKFIQSYCTKAIDSSLKDGLLLLGLSEPIIIE